MQALHLAPSTGWTWVRAGWTLFRRQPVAFIALLFFYWLLLFTVSLVIAWLAQGLAFVLPFVPAALFSALGGIVVAIATPALTMGFLQACRAAEHGDRVHPGLLFSAFRGDRGTLKQLLVLGAIQMAALACIVFATSGLESKPVVAHDAPTVAEPNQPAAQPVPTAESEQARQEALRQDTIARTVQAMAYLPVSMVMWYAPMLVAWNRLPAGKALFFSIVAVWRNLGAFTIYGLGWLAIFMGVAFSIGVIASVIGMNNLTALVALPLVVLLVASMYCSIYPTYSTVFVAPDPQAS